jgi:hypothetical protein
MLRTGVLVCKGTAIHIMGKLRPESSLHYKIIMINQEPVPQQEPLAGLLDSP